MERMRREQFDGIDNFGEGHGRIDAFTGTVQEFAFLAGFFLGEIGAAAGNC